jgi:hypothetical protein
MRAIAVEEELGAGVKTVKEQREATKSGGRVQARRDAACWHGFKASITKA